LPVLLADQDDREKMLTFLNKLMADRRVQNAQPTKEQQAMFERIRTVLNRRRATDRPFAAVRKIAADKHEVS
jgi:hypothetical protein